MWLLKVWRFCERSIKKKKKYLKKNVYRQELTKIEKRSGAGADHVYQPKLAWFKRADIFLKIIDCSVSGKNLEMEQDGILNNNASDEKESPMARNRRVTSSFSLAEIAAFMTVFVLDI
jgi:hypothetical protein